MTAFEKIVQLIEDQLGLQKGAISFAIWKGHIQRRMKVCHLTEETAYLQRLRSSDKEIHQLINLIVVPETWFFRDKNVYQFLQTWIEKNRPTISANNCLKILSIPCSSGEEPYSVAITLKQAELAVNSFHIDAVDINSEALLKAQRGVYTQSSFRYKDSLDDQQVSYFKKQGSFYILSNEIKKLVHFYCKNILENHLPLEPFSYHFIFFRNLLIYLDTEARQRAFQVIRHFLHPKGILFVGAAETSLAYQEGFQPIFYQGAYAFTLKSPIVNSPVELYTVNQKLEKHIQKVSVKSSLPSIHQEQQTHFIQEAIDLADQEQFEKALNVCLNYINLFGAHPHIYYLIGLIQLRLNHEDRAEEFLRKTVYLDPTHYEALVYLALICEKKGQKAQADLFKQRAERVYKVLG